MYLDGTFVASKSGTIGVPLTGTANEYIGAGFNGGGWPDESHNGGSTGYANYFNGSISDVAFFDKPLSAANASARYAAGHTASHPLTSVVRPQGGTAAAVTYDPASGTVQQVTDE